jgi:hypothetical protein
LGYTNLHPSGDISVSPTRSVYNGEGLGNSYILIPVSIPSGTYYTGEYISSGTYSTASYDGTYLRINGVYGFYNLPNLYGYGYYVAGKGGNRYTASQNSLGYFGNGSLASSWDGGIGGYIYWAYYAPGSPSLQASERAGNGTSLRVNVNNGSGRVTYNQVSIDNVNWSPNNTTFSGLTSTSQYTMYGRSGNEDNVSSVAVLGTSAGVPNAPSSISYSNVGRNYTIALGASSSDNGATISSYTVQYRTSTDGGTTWTGYTNSQTATWNPTTSKFEYTYSLLTPALTYQFRAYATNATGTSAVVESGTKFVSAGGRRKIAGGTFEPTQTAKRYNAATNQWVDITIAKRYNGATSQWVDLT